MKANRRKIPHLVQGHGRKGIYLARTPGAAVYQFRRDGQPSDKNCGGAIKKIKQFQLVTNHETGGWVDIQVSIPKVA